jgi:hypothetical protein
MKKILILLTSVLLSFYSYGQSSMGDNLGNHRATRDLSLSGKSLKDISTNAFYFNDGSSLTIDGNQQIIVKDFNGNETFNSGSINVSSTSSQISIFDSTNIIYDTDGNAGTNTIIIDGSAIVHITANGIIPEGNELYDLGSADNKFRHLYLSDSSLYFNNNRITFDTEKNTLKVIQGDTTNLFFTESSIIDNSPVVTGTLSQLELKFSSIESANIQPGAITADSILPGTIDSGKLSLGFWAGDITTNDQQQIEVRKIQTYSFTKPSNGNHNYLLRYNATNKISGVTTPKYEWIDPNILLQAGAEGSMLRGTYDINDNNVADFAQGLFSPNTNVWVLNTDSQQPTIGELPNSSYNVYWQKPSISLDNYFLKYVHDDNGTNKIVWAELTGGGDMSKAVYDDNINSNTPPYSYLNNIVDKSETFQFWPGGTSWSNRPTIKPPVSGGSDSNKFLVWDYDPESDRYSLTQKTVNITLESGENVMLESEYTQFDSGNNKKFVSSFFPTNISPNSIFLTNSISSNLIAKGAIKKYHIDTNSIKALYYDTQFIGTPGINTRDLEGSLAGGVIVRGLKGYDLNFALSEGVDGYGISWNNVEQKWVLAPFAEGALSLPYPTNTYTEGSFLAFNNTDSTTYWTTNVDLNVGSGYLPLLGGETANDSLTPTDEPNSNPDGIAMNFGAWGDFSSGNTNGPMITYDGQKRINMRQGQLWYNHTRSLDWTTFDLYGAWGINNNADESDEIVNYRTATNIAYRTFTNNIVNYSANVIYTNIDVTVLAQNNQFEIDIGQNTAQILRGDIFMFPQTNIYQSTEPVFLSFYSHSNYKATNLLFRAALDLEVLDNLGGSNIAFEATTLYVGANSTYYYPTDTLYLLSTNNSFGEISQVLQQSGDYLYLEDGIINPNGYTTNDLLVSRVITMAGIGTHDKTGNNKIYGSVTFSTVPTNQIVRLQLELKAP